MLQRVSRVVPSTSLSSVGLAVTLQPQRKARTSVPLAVSAENQSGLEAPIWLQRVLRGMAVLEQGTSGRPVLFLTAIIALLALAWLGV